MGWHVQWSQWRCKSAAFTATHVAADSINDGLARAVEPVALLWALRWLWFGCKPLEQATDAGVAALLPAAAPL